MTEPAFTAADLKPRVAAWLAARYPGAVITYELSIGTWGKALIDVAAITSDQIIGVEIKGAGDSPSRIPLQAAVYSKAASRMWLCCCPSIAHKVWKHKPDAWGRLNVSAAGELWPQPPGYSRADGEPPRLSTSAHQLLQALWRAELDEIARLHIRRPIGKADVEKLRWELAEQVPLEDLRAETIRVLRHRVRPVRFAQEQAAA